MDGMQNDPLADLLTEEQAAGLLLVSPKTLTDWRYKGKGPPFRRFGRSIRYQRSSLLAWFAEKTEQPEKPAPVASLAPTFLAVEVSGVDGTSGHIAAWCPWCERIHRHGAAGGSGNRTAHCHDLSTSPLRATGYDLDVVGPAPSEASAIPDGPMAGKARLYEAANRIGPDLRNQTLRLLTGLARPGRNGVSKQFANGTLSVFFQKSWRLERKGRPLIQGGGLMKLAAELYGVPAGVAAVRILEAATAETLDAKAALGLQRVIDDWVSRGAPKRGANA